MALRVGIGGVWKGGEGEVGGGWVRMFRGGGN